MAANSRKKADTGYKVAMIGLRGIFAILVIVLIIVCLIFLGRKAYSVGHQVFYQTAVAQGEGEDVIVIITDDMSVSDVGDLLRSQGLIEESNTVFWLQEFLSDYHGKIVAGTYILNTSETPREMLEILSQTNTEGQIYLPEEEEESESSDAS